ncbi:MAG: hypothetical protein GX665_05315 [Gammaproteobacteria bacterium]|nr:hypothetical protein [Gammaproteobacteria bacterium]
MSARYQAHNKGRSLWHIIDRSTGRTIGFSQHHRDAVQRCRDLELSAAIQLQMMIEASAA